MRDLFTTPQLRRKGIGRGLIEAVYEKADEHGCCQVFRLTQDFNEVGRRLYDKVAKVTPFIKYQREPPTIYDGLDPGFVKNRGLHLY